MAATIASYFCGDSLNNNFSNCKLCSKEIKNSAFSRNQRGHLKRCHPAEFQLIQQNRSTTSRQVQVDNAAKSGDILTRVKTEVDILPIPNLKPTRKRKLPNIKEENIVKDPYIFIQTCTLNGIFPNLTALPSPSKLVSTRVQTKPPTETDLWHEKLPDVMLRFMIKHNVPLKSVEGEKYQALMKAYLPHLKLFDKKELVMRMEVKYLVLSFIHKSRFKEVDWFVLTIEVWSNPTFGQAYWAVTAHYMWNLEVQSVTIGVFEIHGDIVPALMKDDLIKLTKEWYINNEKIIAVVVDTETGRNIASAVDLFVGENRRLHCFAHTVNLIPANAIKNTNNLIPLLNKVKNIVAFFKDECEEAYDEVKSNGNGNKLKLSGDVCVTWNRTYQMIDRFLLLEKCMEEVLLKYPQAPKMVTPDEVGIMKEVSKVLNPFIQVVDEICEESNGQGSKLIPMIHCLKSCMQKKETVINSEIAKELHQNLLNEMEQKFQCFEEAKVLTITSLLDPRFKKVFISNQMNCADAVSNVVQEVFAADESEKVPVQYSTNDFQAYHEFLVAEGNRRIKEAEIENNMAIDVEHHLQSPCIPRHADPIQHWKNYQAFYPRMGKVALKYLIVCASSIPAERLFTKAGQTWTEARNELKGKKLAKLMFLQSLKESEWKL